MVWKRSEVTHEELGAIYTWMARSYEICGWPAMQREDMYHSQLKETSYDARMVRIAVTMPNFAAGNMQLPGIPHPIAQS